MMRSQSIAACDYLQVFLYKKSIRSTIRVKKEPALAAHIECELLCRLNAQVCLPPLRLEDRVAQSRPSMRLQSVGGALHLHIPPVGNEAEATASLAQPGPDDRPSIAGRPHLTEREPDLGAGEGLAPVEGNVHLVAARRGEREVAHTRLGVTHLGARVHVDDLLVAAVQQLVTTTVHDLGGDHVPADPEHQDHDHNRQSHSEEIHEDLQVR